MTNPLDPITAMAAAAAATHEIYRAYVEAGFTEAQALQLVVSMQAASIEANGGRPPAAREDP